MKPRKRAVPIAGALGSTSVRHDILDSIVQTEIKSCAVRIRKQDGRVFIEVEGKQIVAVEYSGNNIHALQIESVVGKSFSLRAINKQRPSLLTLCNISYHYPKDPAFPMPRLPRSQLYLRQLVAELSKAIDHVFVKGVCMKERWGALDCEPALLMEALCLMLKNDIIAMIVRMVKQEKPISSILHAVRNSLLL